MLFFLFISVPLEGDYDYFNFAYGLKLLGAFKTIFKKHLFKVSFIYNYPLEYFLA